MAVEAISATRLMGHVERFSRHDKPAGSAGELASFHDLRAEMDALGFATELILHEAYISLPGAASIDVAGERPACITHSFSIATSGVTGAIIDIGEGTAADFAGRDLRGRVLLVAGIASPEVSARASAAGAIGQIHVSPHEHLHEMCVSPVWGSPSPDHLGELPRTAIVTVARTDGERIAARLGERPVEARIRTEVDTGWRKIPLLVADMSAPGEDEDTPFILLAGHHDSWHVGAMDNGSANAAMIEIARTAANQRSQWRRGLRLCFWSGHSQGRYAGSAWYADHHWDELDRRCAVHINVDCLGGMGACILGNAGCAGELAELADRAITAETGQRHAGRRLSRSADMSFWGIGIPSMFGTLSHQPPSPVPMRNPLGWWWHTPQDTPDKIDPEALARDTRIVLRAVQECLLGERLPLDLRAQTQSLRAELVSIGAQIAPLLDAPCAAAARLDAELAAGDLPDALLMKISRLLVPLEYTCGDRFVHDAALPQPAWPALQPLRDLAAAASEEERRWRRVEAIRARNRVIHALRQAQDLIRPR